MTRERSIDRSSELGESESTCTGDAEGIAARQRGESKRERVKGFWSSSSFEDFLNSSL